MWYPIHAINLNFLMVKGRSDLFLRVEIVKKVLGICILLVVMNFNVQVMAAGNMISSFIALFINTYYTKKLAGYGIAKQLKDILPCLMLSLISSIPAFLLSNFFPTNGLILTASIIIAVVIYILASKVLKLNEFIQVKSNLMSMIHTKK